VPATGAGFSIVIFAVLVATLPAASTALYVTSYVPGVSVSTADLSTSTSTSPSTSSVAVIPERYAILSPRVNVLSAVPLITGAVKSRLSSFLLSFFVSVFCVPALFAESELALTVL